MTVTIRNAQERDCPAVAELLKEMLDFHGQRDPHFARAQLADEVFTEAFVNRIKEESSILVVAEVGGQVVGYAHGVLRKHPQVLLHREYGEVNEIAVTATHRHHGIGQALFSTVLEWFTSQGIARIEARIATSNEVSSQFWRKLGFEPYLETLVLKTSEKATEPRSRLRQD